MIVVALLPSAVVFQFLAAYLSIRFVLRGRLGRPWLLVSAALAITGGVRLYTFVLSFWDPALAVSDPTIDVINFSVSFLLGVGFVLTERWFLLRQRLEGRFRLIADVDRALIGMLEENRILAEVCEGLVRGQGVCLAWIGIAESDGSVHVVKEAGECTDFLAAVAARWDDSPEGACPPGAAVRSGEPCVVNDVAEDPRTAPWRSVAEACGVRSVASVRIDVKKSQPMVLSIAGTRQNAFDRLEMEALAAMACRVGNAVLSARRHEMFVCAKKSYGDLLQSQRDGVVLVRGGAIVRVNPAAVRLLGYRSEDEMLGQDPEILFSPSATADAVSRILAPPGLESETLATVEMRRKDGSRFEGELASAWAPRAFRNKTWEPEYHGPLGMLIFRDVTRRTQTLDELRKERDFSATVLDAAAMLVLQIAQDGEILLFNRQCEEATGYTAAEAVGRRIADFLLPDAAVALYRRACGQTLAGQVLPAAEYPLLTKSGEERMVVWNFAQVSGSLGAPGSVLAAGTDVTERRRFERAVMSMQKMEAVGTLAGGVAHDFNNILTGILGNLDLARKVLPRSSQARLPIEESIQASERAAHLIRQLLEFSRRSSLERRPADLSKVVREVVHLVSQTIDKRIDVAVAVDPDLWPSRVDSNQVHQVLMNLCVNARDAIMERLERGEAGSREADAKAIWVRAENVTIGEEYCRVYTYARPGDYVVLSIADNGIGMDEATQRRVFEPFFTTKGLGRGTGLGLSTAYGIIKQHEGWITLDSEPGTGTTFRCYFPRSADSPEDAPTTHQARRSTHGKETILLVDDEEMIRELGKQILHLRGYRVITAADGEAAIDIFLDKRREIDLVLLDLTMPHMSGLEVLERIRIVEPGAKVVLSSGLRADEVHGTGQFSRASAFLPKPYRAEVLARVVRDVLDGIVV